MRLRHITTLLTAGALALTGLVAQASPARADDPAHGAEVAPLPAAMPLSRDPKIKAWQDLRFGLFIHWGV